MSILIEKKTLSANASLTFSGLEGDTDFWYRLMGRFRSTCTTTGQLIAQFNGDTNAANYNSLERATKNDGGSVTQSDDDWNTAPGLFLAKHWSNREVMINIDLMIFAASGYRRYVQGASHISVPSDLADTQILRIGGIWSNTADELTQIVLTSQNGSDVLYNSGSLYLFKERLETA